MQLAFDIQSNFPDTSLPDAAAYVPHGALELRLAETSTSVSQLEADLQTVPVVQFTEDKDAIEHI
jgi:hypothetical protein